jgi:hypothetical protein
MPEVRRVVYFKQKLSTLHLAGANHTIRLTASFRSLELAWKPSRLTNDESWTMQSILTFN